MAALVGIVMGSDSDLPTMQGSAEMCERFRVEYEMRIISAHRTPDDMAEYGRTAHARGLRVIIAGAGGAAHLPGMLAAHTPLPVIGVPVPAEFLRGLDALLSIAQMPRAFPWRRWPSATRATRACWRCASWRRATPTCNSR